MSKRRICSTFLHNESFDGTVFDRLLDHNCMTMPIGNNSTPRLAAPAVALVLMLGACSTPPIETPTDGKPIVTVKSRGSIEALLLRADRAESPKKETYILSAAEQAIKQGNFQQSKSILDLLPDQLPLPEQQLLMIEVNATNSIELNSLHDALRWLSMDDLAELIQSSDSEIKFGQLRANVYSKLRRYVASAKERIFIDSLLTSEVRQANHEQIWNALTELPHRTLQKLAEQAITNDLRGWLSLTAMTKQYQDNPTRQLLELQKWQKIWSHHPATNQLPASLRMLTKVVQEQPKHIALMLPLQGDLGTFGRAIRNGFLAAYYAASFDNRPLIKIYDTSLGDIQNIYRNAVDHGAEFVVGPLDRGRLQSLQDLDSITVPILALNRATNRRIPGLYQFGLAPEDEVLQVVRQAHREGYRRAIVIAPDTDWGKRNEKVFVDSWQALDGEIVDTLMFSSQKDYSDVIKSLLDVDQSEERANRLRQVIRERFEFKPRRRKDIDFVFLLANPAQARGINPTLAFYYAEDLPVYSTSHINENLDSKIASIDLNGIRFCDIPWKLTEQQGLPAEIKAHFNDADDSLGPFYALGVDAYHLLPRLPQLDKVENYRLFGTTGVLTLDDNNVINRRLMWASIKAGDIITLPMIFDQASSQ